MVGMNDRHRVAIVSELAERLRASGSWCGETHLQKATYFLQKLLEVPTEYEFVLYKYGPYAFDFHDHLRVMRSQGFLELERQAYPYGPRLTVTQRSQELRERFPKTLARYEGEIAFVAQHLGTKGVTDLEQLATALLVTLDVAGDSTREGRAQVLTDLKPHISADVAERAVEEVDRLIEDARQLAA
jgi:uncharacterized protein YwgA